MVPPSMASVVNTNSEKTRHRILDAAEDVFSQMGYHDAPVEEIGRVTSMSKGGIYFHFPSKEDLFFAVLDRLAGRLESRINRCDSDLAHPPGRRRSSHRGGGARALPQAKTRQAAADPGLQHGQLLPADPGQDLQPLCGDDRTPTQPCGRKRRTAPDRLQSRSPHLARGHQRGAHPLAIFRRPVSGRHASDLRKMFVSSLTPAQSQRGCEHERRHDHGR